MKRFGNVWLWLLAGLVLALIFVRYLDEANVRPAEVPYSQVKSWLRDDLVAEVDLTGNRITVHLKESLSADGVAPRSDGPFARTASSRIRSPDL